MIRQTNITSDTSILGKRKPDSWLYSESSKRPKLVHILPRLQQLFDSMPVNEREQLLLKYNAVLELANHRLSIKTVIPSPVPKDIIERVLYRLASKPEIPVNVDHKFSTGPGMFRHLCGKWLKNDIDDVKWWQNGTSQTKTPIEVGPITADNFLLIYHVKPIDMVNGKLIIQGKLKSMLFQWLKANDLEGATITRIRLSLDKDARYGGSRPQPFTKFKIGTSDIPIRKILSVLSDKNTMAGLANYGFHFFNIDIKVDLACTITDRVRANIQSRVDTLLSQYDFQLVPSSAGNNCIVLCDALRNVQAKFYNKFEETVSSPGVYNTIGCQIHKWLHTSSANLRAAIAHPETQKCGLSRLEIRIGNLVPDEKTCLQYINDFKQVFLPDTNFTPIAEQWKMIQPQHTVVIYDTYTGNYCVGYWNHRCIYSLVGLYGKEKNPLRLFHRLKLCTLGDLPIDVYFIQSKVVEFQNNTRREVTSQFDFTALNNDATTYPPVVMRDNWTFKHIRLYRAGYHKTHFVNNSLYTSRVTDANLADIGLPDTDFIKPSMGHRRIKPTAKLTDIQLYEKPVESKNDDVVKDGVPADGQYGFIESFHRVLSLPLRPPNKDTTSGDLEDSTLCLRLSNGDVYACHDQWLKWKTLFMNNECFVFHVIHGQLCLAPTVPFPRERPLSMLKIPENVVFVVTQTRQQYVYKKQRMVFMIEGFPHLSFVATAEMESLLKAGYIKFRACAETTSEAGHKQRAVEPYVVC